MIQPESVSVKRKLGVLAPWIIAAGLLAWLFSRVPLADLGAALARVSLPVFLGACVTYVACSLVVDSAASFVTFRRALPAYPLRYIDAVRLRASTYLFAILHYGAGQGGMVYLLHERHGIPALRAAGAIILSMGVNALLIAGCAALGLAVGGASHAPPAIRTLVLALAAVLPAYLAVVWLRPGFLARRDLLRPLFDAGIVGNLAIAAARLPHLAVLVAGHFAMMRLFGIHTPPAAALALLPVVFVIGHLPISPSGIGTAQATAVLLFSSFAPGDDAMRRATVLAYSLSFHFGVIAVEAVIGLACLRSTWRTGSVASTDAPRRDEST
ncbi:MAG: hypothetical protein EXR73_10470 [Myxococcales bacterium]|nr:hypothetical protein [Myxococcales bacterium]